MWIEIKRTKVPIDEKLGKEGEEKLRLWLKENKYQGIQSPDWIAKKDGE